MADANLANACWVEIVQNDSSGSGGWTRVCADREAARLCRPQGGSRCGAPVSNSPKQR